MVFSVLNKDSKCRRTLTDLLLSMYPGSVVYELDEPADVVSCLRNHTVDVVIWELTQEDSRDLGHLNLVTAQYPGTLHWVCADDDTLLDEAMWNGASMYLIKPLLPEQIMAALSSAKKV